MKKLKLVGLVVILGLVVGSSAMAAEFIKPSKENATVTIPANETHHNLYTAGGNVIINGRVTGDLFVTGGMVNVVGEVEDDLFVASGNLDVAGRVGGNLRVAGGNLSLKGTVGQDLFVAGGNVFISESAAVSGDLIAAGGNLDVQAPVNGKAQLTGGVITINSTIRGDVTIRADEKLTFGPRSVVTGKITYYGNNDPVIQDGAQVGTIDRKPIEKKSFAGFMGVGVIVSFLAFLAAALALMYLLKRELTTVTDMIRAEPWASLGIGLVSLILGPILFILLLITFIGYYIAFLLLVWYVLALMLSCIVGAVFLGRWLFQYIDRNTTGIDWRVVVVGVLAFEILKWIPFIGWFVMFLITIAGFGAILRLAKHQLRKE
jgi:hypothetical protein